MTQLFTREGTPATPCSHVKGKPYALLPRTCGRCGGAGRSDRWAFTGYTCYDCGGSGRHKNGPLQARLYTTEELEKLNERRDRAREKKREAFLAEEAKRQAEADARRDEFRAQHRELLARMERYLDKTGQGSGFVADVYNRAIRENALTEKQVAALVATLDKWDAEQARKAGAQHVGTVGERLRDLPLTVVRVYDFQRPSYGAPWQVETVWITTMRDENGNTFIHKGKRLAGEGASVTVTGTVKAHDTYRDEAQTVLQRVTLR